MVYKRIRLQYGIRILLICMTITITVILIIKVQLITIPILTGGLVLYQIIALLQVMEKPQRDITRFFEAIRYSDFSQSFSDVPLDKSLQPMKETFTQVMNAFQKIRAEKEANYRYLQTIVQNIGVGVLVFKADGKIDLANHHVHKLLGITHIHHINKLKEIDSSLPKKLRAIKSNEKSRIQLHQQESRNMLTLAVYKTQFILQEETYTLISIQNIQSELEEKEMEAWQNLIRVLTHEIMNSITPISSLSSTAKNILSRFIKKHENITTIKETIADVSQAVQTIENRCQGLLKFVQSYRQLTRLPKPDFKIISLSSLFRSIEKLMVPDFKQKNVLFTTKIDPSSLEITADQNLIEQVIINLLQNALDWCSRKTDGKVVMQALMGTNGQPVIQVIDNGPGIQKEAMEKIFIPFFTTKNDGTGIGLSLSRQIMRLHKATITAHSIPGKETIFTLWF